MTNINKASQQWLNRPADERFWTLEELSDHCTGQMTASIEQEVKISDIAATIDDENNLRLCFDGECPELTNWAFTQLCSAGETNSTMLAKMPGDLAADVVTRYTLPRLAEKRDKMILLKTGDEIRSATSSTYGRLWNADLVRAISPATEHGWRVPPARARHNDDTRNRIATEADILPDQEKFGLSVKVGDLIGPAGLYAGDRDCFMFLIHPDRIIDDGGSAKMQGIIIENSELGNGSLYLGHFLFDTVCGNHIMWGVSNVEELKLRHTKGNLDGVATKIRHWWRDVSEGTINRQAETLIAAARQKELGKNQEEVIDRLYDSRRLALQKQQIEAGWNAAVEYEHVHGAPNTLWGMVSGLTRYSQTLQYADARYVIDSATKRLMEMVA